MRRCLHSLLVGVLTFSLSVDVARACGHLRFQRCAPACCPAPTVIVVGSGCGCGESVLPAVVIAGCEEIACGAPLECCGSAEAAVVPSTRAPAVTESVVAPATPAPVTGTTPAEPTPAPVVSVVPNLEPVSPASATEPAPEPPAPIEEPGSEPEEMAAGDAEPPPVDVAEPADLEEPRGEVEPMAEPPVAVEPESTEPATTDTDPEMAGENAAAEEEPGAMPDAPEPVEPAPADTEEPPAPTPPQPNPFDEPDSAASEPQRRWIDDTASYAVVGRLVDVRGDAVDILRADGRLVTVPLGRLSAFDRDYVGEVGPRLAARKSRGPRPTDTASR